MLDDTDTNILMIFSQAKMKDKNVYFSNPPGLSVKYEALCHVIRDVVLPALGLHTFLV